MPGKGLGDEISLVRSLSPTSSLAIISGMPRTKELRDLISRGGISFIPKTISVEQFIKVMHFIAKGGLYLPPEMIRRGGDKAESLRPWQRTSIRLTPRERDVLTELRQGRGNRRSHPP